VEEFEIDNGYRIRYEVDSPYVRWREINSKGLETLIHGEVSLSRDLAPDESYETVIMENFYKKILESWRKANGD